MAVIYVLLPLAVLLAASALIAFVRAVFAGQFDDLDTPPHRILHDDEAQYRVPQGSTQSAPSEPNFASAANREQPSKSSEV